MRRSTLFTVATVVALCADPVGLQAADEPYQPASDQMSWSATMYRWERRDPGSMRGFFGLLLSSTHMYTVKRIKFSFREERSNGVRRMVMEKGEWDCTISDLYYQFPDGGRAPGGPDAFAKGQLDLKHSSASVDYRIDRSTGKKTVQLNFGVEHDNPSVKYRYFPMKEADDPTGRTPPRVDDQLTDGTITMQREGHSFDEPYRDDNNITLRSHVEWPGWGETWIVRGWSQSEPPELVLEPESSPNAYHRWLPQAQRDESRPGNVFTVRARLQRSGGGPPHQPARRIRFEMTEVSNEPGVAINWPRVNRSATSLSDLRIESGTNPQLIVERASRGRKATTPEGQYAEASVVISCYDWGAFGRLRAVAEIEGGPPVVGHLKNEPGQTEVLIPKRKEDSFIADYAKELAGVQSLSDDSDVENEPAEDRGVRGDGLTLYEEYRGFYENGRHHRALPKKKDFFVLDRVKNRTKDGIDYLTYASGLQIWHELNEDELPPDRVINANFSPRTPRRVDQHGVIIVQGTSNDDHSFVDSVTRSPSTPKNIKRVVISPQFDPGENAFATIVRGDPANIESHLITDQYALMVAHELAHSVNVWHHGESDLRKVRWHATKDSLNNVTVEEGSKIIMVRWENNVPVDPQTLFDRLKTGRTVYVARFRGQHSGNDQCLMRYAIAGAYVPNGNSSIRYWVYGTDIRGLQLCMSADGTGVNLATRSPRTRYGDAATKRGNCKHQVRVCDDGTPPQR